MSGIIRVTLDFDGVQIDDFKDITENEIEVNKVVHLMRKTTTAGVTPRYGFKLTYVVPSAGKFDFSKIRDNDAVVVIHYDGGTTTSYRGVRLLKKGESKIDGEKELEIVYEFCATDRDPAL
jgi:hypothetical protein